MGEGKNKSYAVLQIFNVLGSIIIGVGSFIGLLFQMKGSVVLALLLTLVLLAGLVLLPSYMKKHKLRTGAVSASPEYMMLGLYVVIVGLLSFPFIFHAVNVNLRHKSELKEACLEKLETVKGLQKAYYDAVEEKIDHLGTDVNAQKNSYLAPPQTGEERGELEVLLGKGIRSAMDDYERKRMTTKKFEQAVAKRLTERIEDVRMEDSLDIDDVLQDYEKAKYVFEHWKLFQVSGQYAEIARLYGELEVEVEMKVDGHGVEMDYERPALEEVYLNAPLRSLQHASAGDLLLLLLGVVIAHLLVLAEYWGAERGSRLIQGGRGKNDSIL